MNGRRRAAGGARAQHGRPAAQCHESRVYFRSAQAKARVFLIPTMLDEKRKHRTRPPLAVLRNFFLSLFTRRTSADRPAIWRGGARGGAVRAYTFSKAGNALLRSGGRVRRRRRSCPLTVRTLVWPSLQKKYAPAKTVRGGVLKFRYSLARVYLHYYSNNSITRNTDLKRVSTRARRARQVSDRQRHRVRHRRRRCPDSDNTTYVLLFDGEPVDSTVDYALISEQICASVTSVRFIDFPVSGLVNQGVPHRFDILRCFGEIPTVGNAARENERDNPRGRLFTRAAL
ncbi:hypothetical protein EVAR_80910_1 [Eumeta japonica]|uniref:Uncharacterized protein n=1 Tax=Eumeta variegata TaxID=151549 RepID=A0A4C1V068_EUMVA|nr:hypothetical protein EVAR_80910_1 [Eumeta japonica]